MSIGLLQTYPRTPDDFAVWSFGHAAHHRDILRRIFETKGKNLQEFVLDPFDPSDMGGWVDQHRIMHEQMDSVLNIQSNDLSYLDWSDQENTAQWLQSNFVEHSIAASQLGIG
jgi:hypothetical protein